VKGRPVPQRHTKPMRRSTGSQKKQKPRTKRGKEPGWSEQRSWVSVQVEGRFQSPKGPQQFSVGRGNTPYPKQTPPTVYQREKEKGLLVVYG